MNTALILQCTDLEESLSAKTYSHSAVNKSGSSHNFWESIQSSYQFLMDEDLIQTCRSAENQLQPQPKTESQFTITEFYQLWKELNDWLSHMRARIQREILWKAERYEIDLDAHHDLESNFSKRQALTNYANSICESLPRLKDEVVAKMSEIDNNWSLIEDKVSSSVHALQQREILLVDLAFELNELQVWLVAILNNELLPPECNDVSEFASLTEVQKSDCLHYVQQREDEIQSKLKAVSSIRKVLDRLRSGTDCDEDEHRIQNLLDLTERLKCHFYELWLQLLEFKYSLDSDFLNKQRHNIQFFGSTRQLDTIAPSSWGAESGFVSQLSPVHNHRNHRYAAVASGESATGSISSCDVLPFSDEEYEKLPTICDRYTDDTKCGNSGGNAGIVCSTCDNYEQFNVNSLTPVSRRKRPLTNSAPILRSIEKDLSVKELQRNLSLNLQSSKLHAIGHTPEKYYSKYFLGTDTEHVTDKSNDAPSSKADSADCGQQPTQKPRLQRQRKCRSASQYTDSLKLAKRADRYYTNSATQLGRLHNEFEDEKDLLLDDNATNGPDDCALAVDDINQLWDDYQVPLYSNISDGDDNDERLDDSHLQWEADEADIWQQLNHRNLKRKSDQNWCLESEELAAVEKDFKYALQIVQSQLLTGMHDATPEEAKRLGKLLNKANTCVSDLLTFMSNSPELQASLSFTSLVNEWQHVLNQLKSLIQCCELLMQASTFVTDTKFSAETMQHQLGCMQFESAQHISDHIAELRLMENKLHDWLNSNTDLHCHIQSQSCNVLHIVRNSNAYLQNLLLLSQWLASLRERCGTKICMLLRMQEKLQQLMECLADCEQLVQQQICSVDLARVQSTTSSNEKRHAINFIQSILIKSTDTEAVLNRAYRLLSDACAQLSMVATAVVEKRLEAVATSLEAIKTDCSALLHGLAELNNCSTDSGEQCPTAIAETIPIVSNRVLSMGNAGMLILLCSIFLALLACGCSNKLHWTVLLRDTQPYGAPF